MSLATLTSKGQITIPSSVRKKLHLHPDDKTDFSLTGDNELLLRPVINILVRFLIVGDQQQADMVRALFKQAEAEQKKLYVPLLYTWQNDYAMAQTLLLNDVNIVA